LCSRYVPAVALVMRAVSVLRSEQKRVVELDLKSPDFICPSTYEQSEIRDLERQAFREAEEKT
ncbi:MAG: hypothetical protein AAFN10_27505, partial [Bacteroidota bacterium]